MVNRELYKDLEKEIKEIYSLRTLDELNCYAKKINTIDIFYKDSDIVSNAKVLIKNYLCKLLMEKSKVLSANLSKENHPNLNNVLSKHLINGEYLPQIVNKFPQINRNIGSIPRNFLKKIAPKKRQSACIKIYELFAEYALKLNYDYDLEYENSNRKENYRKPETKEFQDRLKKIINQKVCLKYHSCGYNGNGFKLTIGNQYYFYKTFFLYPFDENDGRMFNHGVFAEPQMAMFANKNSPKDKFAKFYFGKVGCNFYVDSFLVCEFIEKKDNYIPRKELLVEDIRINETEMHKFDNLINGKIVDFGGIRCTIPEFEDKKVKKIARILSNNIKYKYDAALLRITWSMKEKNINCLRKYTKEYLEKTLQVIAKYKINFPEELVSTLADINKCKSSIKIEKTLMTKDLFNDSIEKVVERYKYYNLLLKTVQEPIEGLNNFGYAIIQIYENIQFVCFFDENRQVYRLRLEELIKNEYKTILELKSVEEIKKYPNIEFYKLLKSVES